MAHQIKQEFEIWLSNGNAKKCTPASCIANLTEVSQFAISRSLTKVGFFEITSSAVFNSIKNNLLKNKIFRNSNGKTYKVFEKMGKLYSAFLKQYIPKVIAEEVDTEIIETAAENDICETVEITEISAVVEDESTAGLTEQEKKILTLFKSNFQRGIRLQHIDFMKLRMAYENVHSEGLSLTDDEITAFIKNNGFETEPNKYAHIDNLLCGVTIAEVEEFIAEQNEIGAVRIWIEPFYNHFRSRLGDAVSADLFVRILFARGKKKYRKDDGYGFIHYSGIYPDGQREEMRLAVANVLKRERTNLPLDEIQKILPAYPPLATKKGISLTDSPYIVQLTDGSYAHIECVYISDDEYSAIEQIIDGKMDEAGSITYEIINAIFNEQLSSIFENNESFGECGVWKAIAERFKGKYSFNNWQIKRRG